MVGHPLKKELNFAVSAGTVSNHAILVVHFGRPSVADVITTRKSGRRWAISRISPNKMSVWRLRSWAFHQISYRNRLTEPCARVQTSSKMIVAYLESRRSLVASRSKHPSVMKRIRVLMTKMIRTDCQPRLRDGTDSGDVQSSKRIVYPMKSPTVPVLLSCATRPTTLLPTAFQCDRNRD